MALTVGELVAYAQIDKSDFQRGTKSIAADMKALQSSTTGTMAGMEGSVVRSLADIQRAIADGLDPADAIRDLDRLERELDMSLRDMKAEADRFAAELERDINIDLEADLDVTKALAALARLEKEAERAGERAGDGFSGGVDSRLREAKGRFDAQGTSLFDGIVDGAQKAGKATGAAFEQAMNAVNEMGPAKLALFGAAIMALPLAAQVAAGGIVLALGGALAAVGFKSAAEADRVREVWKDTVADLKRDLGDAAAPLEDSAIHAAGAARDAFRTLKPILKDVFADLGPDVDAFVDDLGAAVERIGPSLKPLGDAFGTLLDAIGNRADDMGDDIAASITTLADTVSAHADDIATIFVMITTSIRMTADGVSWLADRWDEFLTVNEQLHSSLLGVNKDYDQSQAGMARLNAAADEAIRAAQGLGKESDTAAGGVRNLNSALEEFFAPAQDALSASNDWAKTLQDANKALKDGNPSLLARKMQLENLLGALAKKAQTEKESTGATESSTKAFEANAAMLAQLAGKSGEGRAALDGLATSLGYTIDRTKNATTFTDQLGNKIKILPNGKVVKIEAETGDADKKLDTTKGKVGDVKDKKVKLEAEVAKAVAEVGKVVSKLDGLKGDANRAGQGIGTGLAAGIRSAIGDAIAAAKSLASSALQGAKDFLGIKSPSTVMAEVGKWTVAGLVQGLNDNKKYAVDTVKDMVSKIKEAFKSEPDVADGLIKFVSIGNDSLSALAKKRDELVERLANAKEMAKQVAGTAQEWADITGLKAEDFTGAGDIAADLRNKASAINNFANNITKLAKMGLNKKIIQDIIDAGVEKGATFAEMLVGSDGTEIKALNKAQAAVDKASKKLGKASADAMYDTGKKAGEGYLKGLEASLKDLDKTMKKIVDALVKAIKKELKIKSPSQVMAEIGQYTMDGFAVGMSAMAGTVTATAQSIVSAAVAAAQKAAGMGGMVPGQSGGGFVSSSPLLIDESQLARQDGVAYSGTPANSGGVTVNIATATVREDADFSKLGAQFGFEYMAHA